MKEDHSRSQLEDKALKSAHMYFGQELLPYFHIGSKILRMLPTEQIRLEAVKGEEDILFEMEDGSLAHFEFESVEVNAEDLRRFRMYDAYTGLRYKKPVTTYVICSGKVSRIHNRLQEGINSYQIIPLCMRQRNADILTEQLAEKKIAGRLTKQDLVPLLLSPLMGGRSSIRDRILKAKEMISGEEAQISKEDRQHMEAVLYAFACKFLEKKDLNEVKEVLSMTVLGEMIWSDGEKCGLAAGSYMKLIDLVCRKLQKDKTAEQIAEELEEELPVVERICRIAKEYAPDFDCGKIYEQLKAENG